MTKDDLRKLARQTRRNFVAERGSSRFPLDSMGVASLLALLPESACVAGYVAMKNEADPAELLQYLSDRGAALALPWIGGDKNRMIFRQWTPGTPLSLAAAQFQQPAASAPEAEPTVILMPLVGFDRSGNRLGQGAGYYDRALAEKPETLRIGIAWSVQECASLPADPWDMPLDAVITEKEWRLFPNSRPNSRIVQ